MRDIFSQWLTNMVNALIIAVGVMWGLMLDRLITGKH